MFATYASNYAIAVAALAGALVLAFNGRAATVYRVLGVGFFLFTGAGYGLAGFTHQFQQPTDTLALVSFALTLVGMVFMFMLMNEVAKTRWACCTPCIMRSAQGFAVVSGLAILAVYFLPAASTRLALNITGVHAGLVMLYCLAVWGSGCEIPRVIAALSMIAGYLVQVILTPKCGTPAYRHCFKDCPLPAPTFNHNALFHVLFFIGVTILAVVMNRRPGVAKAEELASSPTWTS
eukprot:SRR837773.20071.p1 GENE.SRR837773.20071~~SRR837773.20071.p1  ORF type:complete len:257 (+),score=72.08 SRR837773.20071:69-773(+)